MKSTATVELLAPAKNLEFGIAAINHGADAVYIGAPRFSARVAASNSITEIEQLVTYAHLYKCSVYVALNTILFDHELDEAEKIIHTLYQMGVDGLIIQDMGLLELPIPPITLIASTQTHNATPEKVLFLEKAGFKRVILARELSLTEISAIRQQTSVELEAFIHGALCASYSGQCYMSLAVCGRSGNRGVCAQPCRSAYHLVDSQGNLLAHNRHLLSLKDMNLSGYLNWLLEAGITSFKIEGRLKDIGYVKNITAFYRQKIDHILEQKNEYTKSSSGKIYPAFIPDTERTFNRGYTIYNIEGRTEKTGSFSTQKSLGKKMGRVIELGHDWIKADNENFSNGDGICFFDNGQNLMGTLINKVEANKIYPRDMNGLQKGTEIFRNHDQAFEKLLRKESCERKIDVMLHLKEWENGFVITATDEDDNTCEIRLTHSKIQAEKPGITTKQIIRQLSKLGHTPFVATDIKIATSGAYFIPIGILNQWRRNVIKALEELRAITYRPKDIPFIPNDFPYPKKYLSAEENIANQLAANFYYRHGAENIHQAYEILQTYNDQVVMTTKHCIRYQLDACPVHQPPVRKLNEPLYLKDNTHTYRLEFDCKRCVMNVIFLYKND